MQGNPQKTAAAAAGMETGELGSHFWRSTLWIQFAPLPRCLTGPSQRPCATGALFLAQNTGRTEAWKVLNPHEGSWDSVARILPNGSLLLPAVGIQDEGTFQCRAFSRSGKEIKSNYQVRVYGKGPRAFSGAHLTSESQLACMPWYSSAGPPLPIPPLRREASSDCLCPSFRASQEAGNC